jgi:ubiquitin carboxyl-terminal hydrolase 14
MNATVQCLKTVPEFKEALMKFTPNVSLNGAGSEAQSITAALRDLYKTMDTGKNTAPFILLQVLHMAFPRFAEKSEHGGWQQQDANECWVELLGMLKQKLPSENNDKFS